LDFMTREIAAASQVTSTEARKLIEQSLTKAPHLNKTDKPATSDGEPDGSDDQAVA